MFIQLLVHLFPLWLDILHLKIMLLASTCVSRCGWEAINALTSTHHKLRVWMDECLDCTRAALWAIPRHCKPLPRPPFLAVSAASLCVSCRHHCLRAGLTFPPPAAPGPFMTKIYILTFQPAIWSVHCTLLSKVISNINSACGIQNQNLSSLSLNGLCSYKEPSVKNLLYDFFFKHFHVTF